MAKNNKSIEEQVEDWCKKQFKGQKYYTKTETINAEIAFALENAPSKQGGTGKNFPDIKCMLWDDKGEKIPVMIEVKGKKNSLSIMQTRLRRFLNLRSRPARISIGPSY